MGSRESPRSVQHSATWYCHLLRCSTYRTCTSHATDSDRWTNSLMPACCVVRGAKGMHIHEKTIDVRTDEQNVLLFCGSHTSLHQLLRHAQHHIQHHTHTQTNSIHNSSNTQQQQQQERRNKTYSKPKWNILFIITKLNSIILVFRHLFIMDCLLNCNTSSTTTIQQHPTVWYCRQQGSYKIQICSNPQSMVLFLLFHMFVHGI